MTKNILYIMLIVGTLTLWGRALYAQFGDINIQAPQTPVVVELFTSQSCSSCPPADDILEKIAKVDNIIALGCHVTYWNHLHWKDTQSQQFCTDRQRAIARHNNSTRVYTPQMVVNGHHEFVGSNTIKTSAAIKNAAQAPLQSLDLSIKNGKLIVNLPDLNNPNYGKFTIWVVGYQKHHTQSIPSGENRGRTITYVNAVLESQSLHGWHGKADGHAFALFENDQIDGYAVLIQRDKYGPIVAAGQLEF